MSVARWLVWLQLGVFSISKDRSFASEAEGGFLLFINVNGQLTQKPKYKRKEQPVGRTISRQSRNRGPGIEV